MSKSFNTNAVLQVFSEGMTFFVMAGLTAASAATLAFAPGHRAVASADPIVLPTVVVTAKSSKAAERIVLPTVVVTAKRSAG